MKAATNSDVFLPKSVLSLRDYSLQKFFGDLVAGLTVGLVALPLAMAFAISSGVLPQAGIYCAVVAGFLISALGGSTTQIGGPTGAFVVVVAGIVQKHGMDGLFMCTMMAGVLLMILGATGLGTAVKFIPRPVVIGFTNGIAVLIASTQIKDFFGLQIDKVPGEFLARMQSIVQHWSTISPQATLMSLCALLLMILMMRYVKRVPGAIVALFLGTGVAWGMGLPLETIDTRFGGIPAGLPHFALPAFRADLILPLLSPTLTVTMLGAIESLLSAVVADRMSGDRHNPNVELFAQGVANFMSPLVGGLPATGAIARTATNIRSGAKTPVAGMIHALVLLTILLVAAPLAKHIPLCVLAAILMVVAYNMGEWREIPEILRLSKADISVWIITFALTVLADLTVAVEFGMVLAALLFIRKVTVTTTVAKVTPEYIERGFAHSLQTNDLPDGVVVYRIHGPFLFGSSDKLSIIEDELDTLPKVVMLRLRNMTAIDATGIHALSNLADKLHASGRHLVLCGMREQPHNLMERADFFQHVGQDNVQPTLKAAIDRAKALLAEA
ncbi:MAG: SulP family inorganic anion transporter [Fimbriimonadales bacterium]